MEDRSISPGSSSIKLEDLGIDSAESESEIGVCYDSPVETPGGEGSCRSRAERERRDRVALALDNAMTAQRMSNGAMAAILRDGDPNVDEKKVSDYRRGKILLPIYLAQRAARALGMRDDDSSDELVRHFDGYDPLVMIRLYDLWPANADHEVLGRLSNWTGRVDTTLVQRLLTLERLETEIGEREKELAAADHDRGVVSLTRAVTESQTYGIAIWPVLAGPMTAQANRIHVSDRVDIRRLDGLAVTDSEVWNALGPALRRVHALPSITMPRWSHPTAALTSTSDPHISMWNLRHLDAPRLPRIPHPHLGLPAVVVSSTVANTWLGYVAGMLAFVLGYGLTSTTDLARGLNPSPTFNPSTDERNLMHDGLLRSPGERRVWFHAAKVDPDNPANPWAPRDAPCAPQLLHVRLVEDNDLLHSTAQSRVLQPGWTHSDTDAVEAWRRSRDTALDRMPSDEWHLPLRVPDAAWGSLEKWEITIDLAVRILSHLESQGLHPWEGLAAVQASLVSADPVVAAPTLRWLRDRGAPFISIP